MTISLNRRELLKTAAAFGAALAFGTACTLTPKRAWQERRDLYPQGVASGDPTSDSVILWTRRPPAGNHVAHELEVEIASDPGFNHVVATGTTVVTADTDWTCRFLAAGLSPRREYWYRFKDEEGFGSRVGRTVTAPAEDDRAPIRFTFVSCQNVTQGAMNAYRRMIFEDAARPESERLAFVLHLGDFIYELTWYPEDRPQGMYARRIRDVYRYPHGEKIDDFHVPTTVEDYRTAYRGYLTDPDLQDARARWPFVCVWDNHEFSWQGWQSQQVFDGKTRPAQTRKVAANQAWFEYQPGRVEQAGMMKLDRFHAPAVEDKRIEKYDELGFGIESNNVAAIQSLRIYRSLRFGANAELILTDNRSFMTEPPNSDSVTPAEFPWLQPQEAVEILDSGRAYAKGNPPATIRYGGRDLPNDSKDAPPQSYLGREQKAWLFERLKTSQAPWKLWGHSFGTMVWRTDVQNLPAELKASWPGASYGLFNGGFYVEHAELLDFVREHGITGLALMAGDKHSFWAGQVSKHLPPEPFEPLAVEFITGSISAPGLFESCEYRFKRDHPLHALYLHQLPDGSVAPAMNMTMLHGVRAALTLDKTNDETLALRESNPEVAPHLSFADLSGHGYATVRVTPNELETEFVCIPRPLERSPQPDGGPLAYRVVHRVPLWSAGQSPRLDRKVIEGTPPLAMR